MGKENFYNFTNQCEDVTEVLLDPSLPFTKNDVLQEWYRVTSQFGIRNLHLPFITHDPKFPVHFGISVNWRIMINTYHLPKNVPRQEWLAFLSFVMLHEIGHYHNCPYDAKSMVKYLRTIEQAWKTGDSDLWFFALNFFSDIVVNFYHSDRHPTFYPHYLTQWFVCNDMETVQNDLGHTLSWKIFVRIHELHWHTNTFGELPLTYEKIAKQIYAMFQLNTAWDDILRYIASTLQDIFTFDIKNPSGPVVNGSDLLDGVEGSGDDTSENALTSSKKSSQKKSTKKSTPKSDTTQQDEKSTQSTPTPLKKEDTHPKHVNYGKKVMPFDLTQTMGNPFDQKFLYKVSENSADAEMEDAIESFCTGMQCGGTKAVKFLHDIGFFTAQKEAKRYCLRAMSKNLLQYQLTAEKKTGEVRDQLVNWRFSDKFGDLNLSKSIASNAATPLLPPYAKKWKKRYGTYGEQETTYKDVLIVTDSSGSMMGLSRDDLLATPFDYAALAGFAILHTVAKHNIEIAIVNYSDTAKILPWTQVTDQGIDQIENALMQYIGCGTFFPAKQIDALLKTNSNVAIFVMSDLDVVNHKEMIQFFERLPASIDTFIFSVGGRNASAVDRLHKHGIDIVIVDQYSDLASYVIQKAKRLL